MICFFIIFLINYSHVYQFQQDNNNNLLGSESTPEEIGQWLSNNRFDKHIETFARFCGDDMLRMSREDFIQICGDADGIRLHNAIHSKYVMFIL